MANSLLTGPSPTKASVIARSSVGSRTISNSDVATETSGASNNFRNVWLVRITCRLESTSSNASCMAEKMVCIPDSRFAICLLSCSKSPAIFSSWNPIRCVGAAPSNKNVPGRSPRPICVMTSSTCRHGAIHLRHTTTARLPNATQIRTTTIQDTTMLFCSHLAGAAKPRAKAGRGGVGAPKNLAKWEPASFDFPRNGFE